MRRLLLFLTAASLSLMAWGTAFQPDFSGFWLASGEMQYQIVRILLAGALFIQFVTYPPRHMIFRILCVVIAVSSGWWAVEQTWAFQMMAFDTLSIMAASIATFVTALEISYEKEEHHATTHTFVS